ncbi:MAG: sulfotransferase [Pseudomonadota bacterium]
MTAAPIFLYGFARSGTTLLTMMVGNHPDVSLPLSVTGLWYRTADDLPAGAPADDQAARALVDRLLAEDKIARWNVEFDRDALAAALRPGHPEDIPAAFHSAAAAAEGKARWANMDILTIDNLERAAGWFPDARFVHIVRDARDIALSHQGMAFTEGNWLEIAQSWANRVGAARRMGELLGPGRHMTMRFEDLIRTPEPVLRRLCTFAGIAFDPAMLAYAEKVDARIPKEKRGLWPALDQPPQLDKIDRWKRQASAHQLYVVQEFAGAELRAHGYECPAQQPFSAIGEAYACLQYMGRGHRMDRLRRRLGLRRLGLRGPRRLTRAGS